MAAFEILAVGFDGGSDKTDDRIIWVWCQEEEWLRNSLKAAPHINMAKIDEYRLGLQPHDYDFIMPKDVQALHDRLRELAGIPQLRDVMRGHDYHYVDEDLGLVRVTFVASDPHDGAYLICYRQDTETGDRIYLGCEASDLRFLPPEENQKP